MGKDLNLTKEQAQVLEVKNRDLLIAASAGSGKTFVVVERIINRIIKDNIDIDKVLIVTFTNAAASELKERILNRFFELVNDNELSEKERNHVTKQIRLINRAQISTIHSFCLKIIKNNFFSLGIDPNIRTMDASKSKLMLLESINEVLEEKYESNSNELVYILELFQNEETLVEYIEKTYHFSQSMVNPKLWLEQAANNYLITDVVEDLSDIEFGKEIMRSVKEKLEIVYNQVLVVYNKTIKDREFESRAAVLESILEKLDCCKNSSKYDELYDILHTDMKFQRLPSTKCVNEKLKNEVTSVKEKVKLEIDNITKIIYMNTRDMIEELNSMYPIIKWFVNLVSEVSDVYVNKKRNSSQIDFNDYEHLALEVLEDDSIAKQYINKFEEIYIDEYQDTSYIQNVILKKISRSNRIMVGDVKQSIYSFRNAEPKLFNNKYDKYKTYESIALDKEDEAKIILSKNFRSRKCVLDSVNEIFEKVMSKSTGECEYTEKEYLTYGGGFNEDTEVQNKTEVNIIETECKETNISDELEEIGDTEKEAYIIADKIKKLVSEGKKLYDTKNKKYRDIKYRDIVILLRSTNNKAEIYENALKSYGIPAFSDTTDAFYNGQEVGIILSLLKVIDNMYDDVSLISSMYSIVGKFTLDELIYIRNYNRKEYFFNSILEAYNDEKNQGTEIYFKIKKYIDFLDEVRNYLKTYSIAETLLMIYNQTGIYDSFYLENMGKQKCANLDSLVEMARKFEREEKSSLYQFINYIEIMKDKKSKEADSPKLIGEGENVVRILTIHKSKGLEYPVVFIANASKKYNIKDVSNELVFDKKLGIGFDIYNIHEKIAYPSIIKQAIKEKIKSKIISEEERLLYVAMTRAKEKLYIYGTVKDYDKLKESMSAYQYNSKVPSIVVKGINNYLKLILVAQNFESSDNCNINVIYADACKDEEKTLNNKTINRQKNSKDIFLDLCDKNEFIAEKIDTTFEKKYKYVDSLAVKKKYSVTELKNNSINEDLINNVDISSVKESIPQSITKNINSTDYGTMIHLILEKIDYENINYEKINEIAENVFDIENKAFLNAVKKKIINYINNEKIQEYVLRAKSIKKELPFVIYDDLSSISGMSLNEKTYIQGIIDLFIVTAEDKNIIIDFKTDKIDNEDELVRKYQKQLEVYKKGIELSFNVKVDELFIYSFHLEKIIKL